MSAMIQSKHIVIEYCDNYQKQSLRNRTYITHAQGLLPLIVPIKHLDSGHRQKTNEVQSEHAFGWAANHWKSIQTAYRTAPFFEYYEDDLAEFFTSDSINLQQHNLKIIDRLMSLIGLDFNYTLTEQYKNPINGVDWRGYSDKKHNKSINFPRYTQVFEDKHGFIPNCSFLDALFNLGPQTVPYLKNLPLAEI